MTSSTDNTAAQPQNYILYRTTTLMYQPGYSYTEGETPAVPAVQAASVVGTVIATQQLTGLTGVTAPSGFAYALDADGKYPIGSIYTPPATGSASA